MCVYMGIYRKPTKKMMHVFKVSKLASGLREYMHGFTTHTVDKNIR
jgi:hypothetical protein